MSAKVAQFLIILLVVIFAFSALRALAGSTPSGDPFSSVPAGCTDQGPVEQDTNGQFTLGTGLMPATSLGEDHTDPNATVDTSKAILAQTLLCHGNYAVEVVDTTSSGCLSPTWKYAPDFSWNDFAGSSLVIWNYTCNEGADGTFLIHTGVGINVRRTDNQGGTVWVESLFIVSCADCPHSDSYFGG